MGRNGTPIAAHEGFVPFDKNAVDSTIPEIFARCVAAGRGRCAVQDPSESLTYGELDRFSDRIAGAVIDRIGLANEPVALLVGQGAVAVAAILGTLKAGKIYVPIDPSWPVDALRAIVADCRPTLILTNAENRKLARDLAGSDGRWLDIGAIDVKPGDLPRPQVEPGDACYIYYTSGTTGAPKGVYDCHRNVLHNVMRYTNSLGIGAADRLSLIQSPAFSGTVSTIFSALSNGATLFPFDLRHGGVGRLADWIAGQKLTMFHSVPAIFESLVATGRKLDALRIVRLEGDRADKRHIELFQRHFDAQCVLVNGLGATETGLVRQFFVGPETRISTDTVPVGYPTADMVVRVVDDDGADVVAGGIGEVTVTSRYLALGYWNRPQRTAAAFTSEAGVPGARSYRTGDLGRMHSDGCLEILGRTDFAPKLRGQRIDLPAIEEALYCLDGIDRAVVAIREDEPGSQRLVAYIVASGAAPPADAIRASLAASLPAPMIPQRFVAIDSVPLDRNGKVDRHALPPAGRTRPRLRNAFVAPRASTEVKIAACFGEVLGIDGVGAEDDFFDLGGDSLLYLDLLTLIEQRLEVPWPMDFPGERFTVAAFARMLEAAPGSTTLVPLRAGRAAGALFCTHNHPGNIPEYCRLAARLGPGRAVYGLQRIGDREKGFEVLPIEDHAAVYVREICRLGPDGPVHLCGHCFDGVIAFEAARQLRALGREVGALMLIDTAFPDGAGALDTRSGFGAYRSDAVAAHNAALRHFQPQTYDGKITLFCPGEPHNQQGWATVAGKGFCIYKIPLLVAGDSADPLVRHLTAEPYLSALVTAMDEALDG